MISFKAWLFKPGEDCEDRTLNDIEPKLYYSEEEKLATLRQARGDVDLQLSLILFYNMIIAPIADLLEGPEIIVIPEPHSGELRPGSLYILRGVVLNERNENYLQDYNLRSIVSKSPAKSSQNILHMSVTC